MARHPWLAALTLPIGLDEQRAVVGASGSLRFNDGAKVVDEFGGAGQVANAGTWETFIGANSGVGTVTSRASVTVNSGATVVGDVVTSGIVTKQATATVMGEERTLELLTPEYRRSWASPPQSASLGDVNLECGSAHCLPISFHQTGAPASDLN